MTIDIHDLRSTIVPKSDQLNADQLVTGPIIITVTDVKVGTSKEQPVTIHYAGDGGRPYKPCLTMRKVLILAWGQDGAAWKGRKMELFHEPSVKFGGEVVGGIRISRMSDIPKDIKVSLAATKGKKVMHEIGRLQQSKALEEALAAIAAASGRADMQKARALAEKLQDPGELDSARAAYALKVNALKEAAAKPTTTTTVPAFDLDAWRERIAACREPADLLPLNDEAEALPEGDDKAAVLQLLAERDAQIGL